MSTAHPRTTAASDPPAEVVAAVCAADRVLVLGSPGSGKSSLARGLGRACDRVVTHLDDEHWGPGWTRPTPAAWRATVAAIVGRDRWLVDGNYLPSLEQRAARADLAVLVDVDPATCLVRVLLRVAAIRRGDTVGLPRRVPESGGPVRASRDLRRLLVQVVSFRRREFARVVATVAAAPARPDLIVVVAGRGATRRARRLRGDLAASGTRPLVLTR